MPLIIKNQHIIVAILIAVLVLISYAHTLNYPFILDDELLVRKNYLIRDWGSLPQIFHTDLTISVKSEANFYRPMQTISYLFDYQLWRLNVLGFHLTSILLFIINCLLVYGLIHLITKNFIPAALAALFFSSHPIYCEAVTYISGRAEILMGAFLMLSMFSFIAYSDFKDDRKPALYIFSVFSFILALLSKELALILPLAFLLYDFSFKKENLSRAGIFLKRYLPFIIITAIYIILRLTVLKFSDKLPATANFSLGRRLMIFLANFNFYFGILTVPFGLHMSREFLVPKNFLDSYLICGTVSVSLILGGLVFWYRRNRQVFFWSAWFMLWLIPQSGIFPINSFLADHFIYLSAIGFFVIAALIIKRYFPRKAAIGLGLILVTICSYATIAHNRDWQNEEIFYQHILKFSPKSWLAHVNLGNVYLNQRLYSEAEKEYRSALVLHPALLIVHSDLALVYLAKGQPNKAIMEMGISLGEDNILPTSGKMNFPTKEEYLEVLRKDLDLVNMYNGLGMLFTRHRLFALARRSFDEAIKLGPDYADAHWNLGSLFFQTGEYEKARKEWELTLKLDPGNSYVRLWLGKLYPAKH
jgi:protein O-mannosyl-transferase